jgi:hypothetical protein
MARRFTATSFSVSIKPAHFVRNATLHTRRMTRSTILLLHELLNSEKLILSFVDPARCGLARSYVPPAFVLPDFLSRTRTHSHAGGLYNGVLCQSLYFLATIACGLAPAE